MNMKAIVLTVLIATVMMSPVHGLTKIAKNAKTAQIAMNGAMDAKMDATGAKTATNAMHAEGAGNGMALTEADSRALLSLRGKSGNKATEKNQVFQPYPRACLCRRTSSCMAGPRLCISPSAL